MILKSILAPLFSTPAWSAPACLEFNSLTGGNNVYFRILPTLRTSVMEITATEITANLENSLMSDNPILRLMTGIAVLIFGCSSAISAEYLLSEQARSLNLPFSEAVRVGDMLYVSGQLGNLPGTMDLAAGGIEAEARQAMENIKSILERYGSSMEEVVKCTVMIRDINEWAAFNEIYVTFFPGPKPARSAFAAAGLGLNGRVEVECWASAS